MLNLKMLISSLQKIITLVQDQRWIKFWLWLSLTLSLMYCIPGLQESLSQEYVIQDDARQHIFWMQRFSDPDLFPDDLTADYFASVAPLGYRYFYQGFASVGIDPIFLSKLLPSGLALITTYYTFYFVLELYPLPLASFITTLLLNQNLWMRDDLVSATPVAFVYPLFTAFLYYLVKSSLFGIGITIALLGLFYPQCMLVAMGVMILQLLIWDQTGFHFSRCRENYLECGVSLVVAAIIILPYFFKNSEFGSVITGEAAKTLFAFSPEGWSNFFTDNFSEFWFCGKRSGMMPWEWCYLIQRYFPFRIPPQLFAGLLFPLLFLFPHQFPELQIIQKKSSILLRTCFASLSLFFLAHIFLFKLHLPNRYTEHTARILMAIAGGIVITIILIKLLQFLHNQCRESKPLIKIGLILCLMLTLVGNLILYPTSIKIQGRPFPLTKYIHGEFPVLYDFLKQQPKDIIIASLAEEANNLPTFAQRSILVGGEGYALPYHRGYAAEISERTIELIQAQYTDNLNQLQEFIKKYEINYWLLDQQAFNPDFVQNDSWLSQYPILKHEMIQTLQTGSPPVLANLVQTCQVLEMDSLSLLSGDCIQANLHLTKKE